MQAYRHIYVATDFSEFSEPAAQRAAELAQRYGADLTLIHAASRDVLAVRAPQ